MNFDRIINFRADSNINQRDMAKIFDVSKSQYARWGTGEQVIPLIHLNEYANYSSHSMDYLLGFSNDASVSKRKIILDKKEIGKRLNQVCLENSVTQTRLAEDFNTSQSTVSAYINGKTLILTTFAYHISKKYNISMDWLCGRTNKKSI